MRLPTFAVMALAMAAPTAASAHWTIQSTYRETRAEWRRSSPDPSFRVDLPTLIDSNTSLGPWTQETTQGMHIQAPESFTRSQQLSEVSGSRISFSGRSSAYLTQTPSLTEQFSQSRSLLDVAFQVAEPTMVRLSGRTNEGFAVWMGTTQGLDFPGVRLSGPLTNFTMESPTQPFSVDMLLGPGDYTLKAVSTFTFFQRINVQGPVTLDRFTEFDMVVIPAPSTMLGAAAAGALAATRRRRR